MAVGSALDLTIVAAAAWPVCLSLLPFTAEVQQNLRDEHTPRGLGMGPEHLACSCLLCHSVVLDQSCGCCSECPESHKPQQNQRNSVLPLHQRGGLTARMSI